MIVCCWQGEKANVWDSEESYSKSFIFLLPGKIKTENISKKLMVWDNRNSASFFSKIASWQMGLINTNDWKGARWIAYQILPDKDIHKPLRSMVTETKPGEKDRIFSTFQKTI